MSDLSADLTLAARRAEARHALGALLTQFNLPAADRKAVLLDLAMESQPASPSASAPKYTTAQVAKVAIGVARAIKRGRPVRRRKANGALHDAGRTDTLVATLKGAPGMPVADLAAKVYPDIDAESAKGRTRSLLTSLKKQGRVRNTNPGKWEVTV
jgi:hypothetical protein